ncbi:hypothetical protein FO519_009730 [Halicephalobus sp. NKZ332]|nr:hypothetical protein FO519_009730 [Halicephalobus sp. NKZ332]
MLNLDVYHELAQEFVILGDEDPELTARFILSGKESLISLKQSLRNVETIHFWNSLFYDDDNCPRYSSYVVTIKWSDDVKVNTELEDSYMDPIIRWTLNSVKRVEIDAYKPLPMSVIELLLRNSSFTEIELYHCDSSTLKTLIESRKFNHVYMERSIFLNLNDVHINTEKLELHYVSLENILKTEFLKTNSLMLYSNEEFNDRIFEMNNISLNFQSLENLELVVRVFEYKAH